MTNQCDCFQDELLSYWHYNVGMKEVLEESSMENQCLAQPSANSSPPLALIKHASMPLEL
jgi:hypothetical protein